MLKGKINKIAILASIYGLSDTSDSHRDYLRSYIPLQLQYLFLSGFWHLLLSKFED
jgi:hypothetical protein